MLRGKRLWRAHCEADIYERNDSDRGQNIANSSFVVDAYRTRRRRGLGAELQIDRIEGVPRALRTEINIVFLMLGIIVRVELYEGCAGGVGLLSQRLSS